MSHPDFPPLPLLDLRDFEGAPASLQRRFVSRLREAARGDGFFYLRGHGLDKARSSRAAAQVTRLLQPGARA